MVNQFQSKILESLGKVHDLSGKCRLEDSFFSEARKELMILSDYFMVTDLQALFISIVFMVNYENKGLSLSRLARILGCNPIKILEFVPLFENLVTRGVFTKGRESRNACLPGVNNSYYISTDVCDAIINNYPMPELVSTADKTVYDVLEDLYNLGQRRFDGQISSIMLFRTVKQVLASNKQFPLIQKVLCLRLPSVETFIYLHVVWSALDGEEETDVSNVLQGIFEKKTQYIDYMQKLNDGENVMLEGDLITLVEGDFFNNMQMKLTDKSYKFLKDCGLRFFLDKKKPDNFIDPVKIPRRRLIYNSSESTQVSLLKSLLQERNLKRVQQRLFKKGLPTGVCVLLHGEPGTGKTETVKQLAKQTNREIFKVEISQSKSKWFGESEKLIKKIFTDYKAALKACKRIPILLFNEADALFSKRGEIDGRNTSQTENAIQNILLEELENFEGILVATTNLTHNLDTAFERRFLFKVEFHKPGFAAKAKIWKTKLPQLSKKACEQLAEQFDFSGGQIDNIVRKNEIDEIIHGSKGSLEGIINFCNEELMQKKVERIGFY